MANTSVAFARYLRSDRVIFSALVPVVIVVAVATTAVVTLPLSAGTGTLGRLGGAIVLAGVAAMVLIETAKQLLPLRGAYHRRQVAIWLEERSGPRDAVAMGQLVTAMDLVRVPTADGVRQGRTPTYDRGLGSLWRRPLFFGPGVGGPFNLPAEQLTAQVAAAAERALQQPLEYDALIDALCPGMTVDGHFIVRTADESRREPRAELAYRVAAAVDQLQIRLAGRWRQYLRVTAVWLAGLCALVFALVVQTPGLHSAAFVLAALAFGGFFAWLARDVCAAIERLRR